MRGGDPTLQQVASQQQRHGERLSVLETQMNDIKTQVSSIEETLNSQFSFLCKHLGIPVPVAPSTNFTPDHGSTDAAKSKSEETNPIAAFDEEETDSLELELIPPLFFIENTDVDLLHSLSLQFEENLTLKINCLSEFSPVTIVRMKDEEIQFCVKFFEENSYISKSLMEFFFLHKKLLHMNCSGLHFDYNRFLFDRGKLCVA
ncbi:uncharacterized protein LOC113349878 [Papaver somniferum]|uniref:uncharacterized protein LOC113349878 n=1 Tax=Papaver somniferum TaxID=3469 RepID=UPI000E706016|nr:uncharacterized protein LOC113349878 [Papaver somniferum]